MSHHIFCLTIDIDPDGLSGKEINRDASSFKSFESLSSFSQIINDELKMEIPLTWFIRIDDQMNFFFGNRFYLVEQYNIFFGKAIKERHELAWHPHIYEKSENEFIIPTSVEFCIDQLSSVHEEIKTNRLAFVSFRNGEGWHTNETMQFVEQLGFSVDSTAIPGVKKPTPHLLNWKETFNHPYFPSKENYQLAGVEAGLLEMPMNTWFVKAPYDVQTKLRYMNPAVRSKIFEESIKANQTSLAAEEINIHTLISHPDEIASQSFSDNLYGCTIDNYIDNIRLLINNAVKKNDTFEFLTMQQAALAWRKSNHSIK